MRLIFLICFISFGFSASAYDRDACVKTITTKREVNDRFSSKHGEMLNGSSYLLDPNVLGTIEDTVVTSTVDLVSYAIDKSDHVYLLALMYEFSGSDESGRLIKRDRRLGGIFDIEAKRVVSSLDSVKKRIDSLIPKIRNQVMIQDSREARDMLAQIIDKYQVCRK